MAKMLPEQAVVNKMCQNGYTEEQARQLLGGNYDIAPANNTSTPTTAQPAAPAGSPRKPNADTPAPASVGANPNAIPDHLITYVKMAKMLPPQAVINKMVQCKYSEAQAQQLLAGDYTIPEPCGIAASVAPCSCPLRLPCPLLLHLVPEAVVVMCLLILPPM